MGVSRQASGLKRVCCNSEGGAEVAGPRWRKKVLVVVLGDVLAFWQHN